ncbi:MULTISPECIES: glycosyltransferase [Kitasatospora]|uniref:Putative glycosyltransferase n=1 Tax=Kitasatospora setae (strain ATCC 33774 / DSM 43861 / JCM 3304 / KCC A-0304 / NBRC 14216 / KM-6054) TaxID=452652 RepID=E4N2X1_KITSK|nr:MULTISPECIES: glycosyltransferase [Kitasatospora]BAJ32505.1 putative glycosyltransferase [Kitasatospora setae KM-6054]
MSRFLLAVPPLAGHVNPAAGIADELVARGHEVAWTGTETMLRPLLGPDARVFGTGNRMFRAMGGHGLASLRSLWEGFVVPYAKFTLKPLDAVVREFRPDALLVDQHTPAAALVAHRYGLPWATLAPGALELGRPYRHLPGVEAWTAGLLAGLWERAGLPADEFTDPRFSPHLVLATTGRPLLGDLPQRPEHALVGPVLTPRPKDPAFPWERLTPGRRTVLVTMGTMSDAVGADFLHRTVAALGQLGDGVRAVVAAPRGALPAALPDSVTVVDRAPILELLSGGRLDAVLCHGGMNTVVESLAHGVPVLAAPIRNDQPFVARRVAEAGAGLRVPFARVSPPVIAERLRRVLDEPSHRAAAESIGRQLLSGGGALAAADRMEALVTS